MCRWKTFIKDIKKHLRWSHWQWGVEKAASRSATLTCSAASLLLLWSHQQASQKQPEFWDVLPWYSKKASPGFRDMAEQLRCQIIDGVFLAFEQSSRIKPENEAIIRDLLRLAV